MGVYTLRVQVPNNIELLNFYPKPKYLIIGSFGPESIYQLGGRALETLTRWVASDLGLSV